MRFTLATSFIALTALAAAAPQSTGQKGDSGMAIPISKHSRLVNTDNAVDFDAIDAHVASINAKIHRGFELFEKNTGTKYRSAMESVEKRGFGLGLTHRSEVWFGALAVGNPPVFFTVQFDTGSSDLFLPASTCGWTCGGHTLWDPTSSSTAQDLQRTFLHDYAGGSVVSGEQYTDTVVVGVYSATSQTLGVATAYSSSFLSPYFPADGLMGMAFQSISGYGASPVIQTFISQGQLPEPVFAFNLSSSGVSELYIGGVNTAMYVGDFSYVPVTKQGFWEVVIDNIQGDGEPILYDIDCIIDTGATLIIGNPTDISTLYSTLNGTDATDVYAQGYYTFPCDAFPTISLTFSGTSFPILASALNLGPVFSGASDCVSGIVGLGSSSTWVIGDIFLQGVYTAFDVGNTRVGFAHLA